MTIKPVSAGWAKDGRGTVESYVNPNAHCPVCGAGVYFYRSPYDGRVFFDELGWPWPKHPCTDSSREPYRATPESEFGVVARAEPAWRNEGWHPLLSANAYPRDERSRIAGYFRDEFLQLHLPESEAFDPDSPVFLRELSGKPDFFEITFLRSSHLGLQGQRTMAFRARLAHAGDETLLRAADDDPAANKEIGEYILWELDDPTGARPYLERAIVGGVADAAFDLAIAAIYLSS
jgi:hypothetical protein